MKEKLIPIFSPSKEGYKNNGTSDKGKWVKFSLSAPLKHTAGVKV